MSTRQLTSFDRWMVAAQHGLEVALAPDPKGARPSPKPADDAMGAPLEGVARAHAAGLMRVNHAGEVAAQALYHGQASVTRDPSLRKHLLEAAVEEQAAKIRHHPALAWKVFCAFVCSECLKV